MEIDLKADPPSDFDEDEQRLAELVHSVDGVHGFHDLKTRQAGTVQFIQLHLDMDGQQSLSQAHAIGKKVEQCIHRHFPKAEVLIHHDPV